MAQVPKSQMNLKSVDSSNIKEIGYNAEMQSLFIRMNSNNAVYMYDSVPETIFRKLMASESKGKFFNDNVKNSFKTTKLDKV